MRHFFLSRHSNSRKFPQQCRIFHRDIDAQLQGAELALAQGLGNMAYADVQTGRILGEVTHGKRHYEQIPARDWRTEGVRVVKNNMLVITARRTDEALECVLVRSDNEAVVVNLDIAAVGSPEEVLWVDPIHRPFNP